MGALGFSVPTVTIYQTTRHHFHRHSRGNFISLLISLNNFSSTCLLRTNPDTVLPEQVNTQTDVLLLCQAHINPHVLLLCQAHINPHVLLMCQAHVNPEILLLCYAHTNPDVLLLCQAHVNPEILLLCYAHVPFLAQVPPVLKHYSLSKFWYMLTPYYFTKPIHSSLFVTFHSLSFSNDFNQCRITSATSTEHKKEHRLVETRVLLIHLYFQPTSLCYKVYETVQESACIGFCNTAHLVLGDGAMWKWNVPSALQQHKRVMTVTIIILLHVSAMLDRHRGERVRYKKLLSQASYLVNSISVTKCVQTTPHARHGTARFTSNYTATFLSNRDVQPLQAHYPHSSLTFHSTRST
jgi:hypothetical protein